MCTLNVLRIGVSRLETILFNNYFITLKYYVKRIFVENILLSCGKQFTICLLTCCTLRTPDTIMYNTNKPTLNCEEKKNELDA